MVKKPFKGNYLTFEVRVSYDEKTDSVHLTSKDKDIPTTNGFHLALNGGKDAEYALRALLEEKGMIPEDRFKTIASHAFYGDSPSHDVWDKFPLGVHANGEEAVWDTRTSSHALIIGGTGSGKSVIQRNLLFHCIQNSNEWRVLMIDLLRVESAPYKKYSPTVIEIAHNVADGLDVLRAAYNEMLKRYEEMEKLGINYFLDMPEPPKSLMVMINEVNLFLTPVANAVLQEHIDENELKSEAFHLLNRITTLGRAAGVHMVLSSQRLDKNVLHKQVLDNFTTRIAAGRLDSAVSEALLGDDAAARLNGAIRGRGYVQHLGRGADFQGYFAPLDYLDDPHC